MTMVSYTLSNSKTRFMYQHSRIACCALSIGAKYQTITFLNETEHGKQALLTQWFSTGTNVNTRRLSHGAYEPIQDNSRPPQVQPTTGYTLQQLTQTIRLRRMNMYVFKPIKIIRTLYLTTKMIQEQTIPNSHTSICHTSHLLDKSLSLRKQTQSTTTKRGRRILLISSHKSQA
jgi:hypothetical protein